MESFIDGFARIQNEDGSWNYINQNGKLLFHNISLQIAENFNNGTARVKTFDNIWHLIDTNGNIVVNARFDKIIHTWDNFLGIINNYYACLITKDLKIHRLLI